VGNTIVYHLMYADDHLMYLSMALIMTKFNAKKSHIMKEINFLYLLFVR